MPEQDPPVGTDPGGAHAKGFSADPTATPPVSADGPLPVTDAPPGAKVTHPDYDGALPPTGRDEEGGDERIATRL